MSLERISCPSCGANDFQHDSDGTLICGHCGANFGSPRDHIDCPACGVQNPAEARKCMNCGLTLGKICAVCNHHNPPGTDHCLECATPLDTLSSVMMRSGPGRSQTAKTTKKELVRTKGADMQYMHDQRARLDAEEQARMEALRARQGEAIRQQKLLITITTVVGGLLLLALVLVFLLAR